MPLNLYQHQSDEAESFGQQPANGIDTLKEIERLQNHVLDELDNLDARIQAVFKTFGYRETEPLLEEALQSISESNHASSSIA